MTDGQRKNMNRVLKWLSMALLLNAVLFMGAWIYRAQQAPPWSPLYGPFSGQIIYGQTDKYVRVTGQKCSSADVPVLIRGVVYAQPVSPIGEPLPTGGAGLAVRVPGCTPLKFKNLYIDKMIESTRLLGSSVVWRFTGDETPIGKCSIDVLDVPKNAKGTTTIQGYDKITYFCWHVPEGVTWTWTTANFTLPYKGK